MAEVGRPPVLRFRHQFTEVLLHGLQVETLELVCVVESLAHRIGLGGALVQDIEVQLVRPPVPVRRAAAGNMFVKSGHFFFVHDIYSLCCGELSNSDTMNDSFAAHIAPSNQ